MRIGAGSPALQLRDLLADQVAHLGAGAQILERGVGEVVALGPVADRRGVDRDHRRDKRAAVAEHHRLADDRG